MPAHINVIDLDRENIGEHLKMGIELFARNVTGKLRVVADDAFLRKTAQFGKNAINEVIDSAKIGDNVTWIVDGKVVTNKDTIKEAAKMNVFQRTWNFFRGLFARITGFAQDVKDGASNLARTYSPGSGFRNAADNPILDNISGLNHRSVTEFAEHQKELGAATRKLDDAKAQYKSVERLKDHPDREVAQKFIDADTNLRLVESEMARATSSVDTSLERAVTDLDLLREHGLTSPGVLDDGAAALMEKATSTDELRRLLKEGANLPKQAQGGYYTNIIDDSGVMTQNVEQAIEWQKRLVQSLAERNHIEPAAVDDLVNAIRAVAKGETDVSAITDSSVRGVAEDLVIFAKHYGTDFSDEAHKLIGGKAKFEKLKLLVDDIENGATPDVSKLTEALDFYKGDAGELAAFARKRDAGLAQNKWFDGVTR